MSLILANEIRIEDGCKVGHFNIIICNKFVMKRNATLGKLNRLRGNFDIIMEENTYMDHRVIAGGGIHKLQRGISTLLLKKGAHVVTGRFDLTDSVIIGERTTIAGRGTDFWTHSFYKTTPPSRVDGPIEIGNDCYIGSLCQIMPGLKIADNITVGAGCCVAKSLLQEGTYVNQQLRFIPTHGEKALEKFGEPTDYIGKCRIFRKNLL